MFSFLNLFLFSSLWLCVVWPAKCQLACQATELASVAWQVYVYGPFKEGVIRSQALTGQGL
jgi:hypothetical protein